MKAWNCWLIYIHICSYQSLHSLFIIIFMWWKCEECRTVSTDTSNVIDCKLLSINLCQFKCNLYQNTKQKQFLSMNIHIPFGSMKHENIQCLPSIKLCYVDTLFRFNRFGFRNTKIVLIVRHFLIRMLFYPFSWETYHIY